MASNPPYNPNLDAAPTHNRRPFRARYPIWTPRQPVSGVQSALDPKSGRHANHPLAPNPPYTPNLDATPTTDWRPIRPTPQIWTPLQPVSGVQSAIQPQSGRHADTQQASKSATTKNLDAAPARKWRPIRPTPPNLDATLTPNRRPFRHTPPIWTPPQPVSGVQSALHLQSGRHADTQQASKSATTKNLDAAPARKRRPIRHITPIWTPSQPVSGVQSALHLKSGRRPNP